MSWTLCPGLCALCTKRRAARLLRTQLLGISNAGFLMPEPEKVDLAYLIAAVAWGLDVVMVNPATPLLAEEIRAVDFLLGKDPYAKGYLSLFRARRKQGQGGVNPGVAGAHCAGEGRERY